jgi:hypothetical protein
MPEPKLRCIVVEQQQFLLTDNSKRITDEMRIVREECSVVLPVMAYQSVGMIERVNYGLTASIWTRPREAIARAAGRRLTQHSPSAHGAVPATALPTPARAVRGPRI